MLFQEMGTDLDSGVMLLKLQLLQMMTVSSQVNDLHKRCIDLKRVYEGNKNKINGTNFLAPYAHFDNTCLFSDARGQNI